MKSGVKFRNVTVIFSIALLTFTGCASDVPIDTEISQSNNTVSDTNKQSSTSVSSPAATALNGIKGVKPDFGCEKFITSAQLYEFNPNFTQTNSEQISDNEIANLVSQLNGINCTYVNLSSGETIQLSLSHIEPGYSQELKGFVSQNNELATEPISGQTNDIYFNNMNGHFYTHALIGDYWVVVTSPLFNSASDAINFISPSLEMLR